MSLLSYSFLSFVIISLVIYYLLPRQHRWMVLLAASIAFYLCSGSGLAVCYVAVTTLSVWVLARRIGGMAEQFQAEMAEQKPERAEKKRLRAALKQRQRRLLVAGLLLNFGILAVVKYTNFVLSTVNLFIAEEEQALPLVSWVFPLGISYYSFQSLGYLIDVYHGKIAAERSLPRFALFVLYFPQLVSGPISRHAQLSEELYEGRNLDREGFLGGFTRILWGCFKKLVIADRIAGPVLLMITDPETYSGVYAFLAMLGYSIWVYADFSGAMDLVLGVSALFGIRLPENFNRPFFSKSLSELWRRWHMTLMEWFRDYIFFPLSVSGFCRRLMGALNRADLKKLSYRVPVYLSTLAVWLVAGLWHGASWNFVNWGLANAFVLLLSQELEPLSAFLRRRLHVNGSSLWRGLFASRTFLLFSVIELFEYHGFGTVFAVLWGMLSSFHVSELRDARILTLGLNTAEFFVLLLGVLLMLLVSLFERRESMEQRFRRSPKLLRGTVCAGLLLLTLITGVYGQGYDARAFIYNQF